MQFSFAGCFDWVLMLVGFLAAAANGAVLPTSMIVFGRMINLFVYKNFTAVIAANLSNVTPNTVADADLNCSVVELFLVNLSTVEETSSLAFSLGNFECLSNANFLSSLDLFIIAFACLGAGSVILGFIQVSTFSLAAMRQTHRIRKRFYRSILRQNVAWFDENKAGELNSRLVE